MIVDFDAAVKRINAGGCLVYPTETFYALGGDGFCPEVGARIAAIKGRPEEKPFPLLFGGWEQWSRFVRPHAMTEEIARLFWPGPVSILVRLKGDPPASVRDGQGWTSVRLTPHPVASALCLHSGTMLVATSANRSGRPAAADPRELDSDLVRETGCLFTTSPPPAGGNPSTLIRVLGSGVVEVLRDGAVTRETFAAAGITVRGAGKKFEPGSASFGAGAGSGPKN